MKTSVNSKKTNENDPRDVDRTNYICLRLLQFIYFIVYILD